MGRTGFLAYSTSPEHPSRSLPIAEDPPAWIWASAASMGENPQSPVDEPLHRLIRRSAKASEKVTDKQIFDSIRAAFAKDGSSINKVNWAGEHPIHVAARVGNVVAIRTLLQLGATTAGHLENRDNRHGLTPLEICEHTMIRAREVGWVHPSIGRQYPREPYEEWTGNPEAYLIVAKILRQAGGEVIASTDDEWIKKNKWGCTCGQCADGWLSLRMRRRIYGWSFPLSITSC
jgi:hypothetical protein